MFDSIEEEITRKAKDIFNKQDTRLVNFALQDVYTFITGKQKYVKTELDLIIVLYQLWTSNGKKELTLESSVSVTTAHLNWLLGVARTVSSTLTNLKKYAVHEKKVFALDENGNRFKVGKSYAKDYITVIPDVILFEFTVKDEFVKNDRCEIVGRNTMYTIKPSSVLVSRLHELGLGILEETVENISEPEQTETHKVVEENVQEVNDTLEDEELSFDMFDNEEDIIDESLNDIPMIKKEVKKIVRKRNNKNKILESKDPEELYYALCNCTLTPECLSKEQKLIVGRAHPGCLKKDYSKILNRK